MDVKAAAAVVEKDDALSRLMAREAYIVEYQKSVEEDMAARRKAAREGQGGTRDEMEDSLKRQEVRAKHVQ